MTQDVIGGLQQVVGCTIADRARLTQALALRASFLRHHPDSTFAILASHAFSLGNEACHTPFVTANDLNLPPASADRLLKTYDPDELSRALKPSLLRQQLSCGAGCVVFLAPDFEVFGRLTGVLGPTRAGQTALTVRLNSTADIQNVPNKGERFSLEPGFVAVGRGSAAFLDWWTAHVHADVDAERPLQRDLLDQIPAHLGTYLLDSPSWNLGYWNLPGRALTAVGNEYAVDGEPLRLFNFSGYDIDQPHLLSRHQGHQPRVRLSESPVLEKICRDYERKVRAAELEQRQRWPHGFGFLPSGIKIDRHMHRLNQQAIARFEAKAGPRPPDPMSAQGETPFIKWLNQRMTDGKPEISRYMLAVHAARPDLQIAFPEPLGANAFGFHSWFLNCGASEENVPRELMPGGAAQTISLSDSDESETIPLPDESAVVEIIGYFRAELGNGETARLLVSAFEAASVPFTTTVYDRTASRQNHAFEVRTATAEPDIQLICINADQLPDFAATDQYRRDVELYRIGLWFWEVDEFPGRFDSGFDLVDEVWTTSEFVANAIGKVSPKPVIRIPQPIVKPVVNPDVRRSAFNLPDRFCFLFNFDFLSVLERKNAVGLITAFTRAFAAREGPILVIKSINGDQRVLESERLKYAAAGHPDIYLMDGYLSALEKNSLTAACDCYVSLHRSEGFGQTIAEAMALGKPAIATAYSGNLDFMTPENSYLCPYAEREVGAGCEPYPATAHWAEPDLDAAAALLRRVYENQDEAHARGLRAAEDIAQRHSPLVAGRAIRDRLAVIRRHRQRRLRPTPISANSEHDRSSSVAPQ